MTFVLFYKHIARTRSTILGGQIAALDNTIHGLANLPPVDAEMVICCLSFRQTYQECASSLVKHTNYA